MHSKTASAPLSKTNLVKLYRSILIMLLICGFYFNVRKPKLLLKIVVSTYSVFLIIINIFTNFACCPGQELSVAWSVVEYTASVLLTLVINTQIANYFQKLTEVDTYLRIGKKYYLDTKRRMFMYTFILWAIRIIYTILYWIWFPTYEDLPLFVISQFSLIALDLNRVWRFVLFDMTRYRLKMLRCRMEEMKNYNFFCYVSNSKTLKQSRIRFCLHLYKSLADAIDVMLPELNASLFISLVCTLPKLILNAYHILLVIEELEPYASAGFAGLHVAQVTLFIVAPCVVVELYAVEVERMRLLLMHNLFDDPGLHVVQVTLFIVAPCVVVKLYAVQVERMRLLIIHKLFDDPSEKSLYTITIHYTAGAIRIDKTTKEDVDLFLRYTKVRPFRYHVWRVLPVTIALPLELINLCTTYVIVLINFTHLYG